MQADAGGVGITPDAGRDAGTVGDGGPDAGTPSGGGTDGGMLGGDAGDGGRIDAGTPDVGVKPPYDCVNWGACGGPQVTFSEGFENGFGDWSVEGGVWAVGQPTLASGPTARRGSAVAGTVLDDDYPTSLSTAGAWLVSPEFTVPVATDNPVVRVWIWSQLRESHRAAVLIREVGGNWVELDRFFGDNGQWVQKRFNLSAWAERDVQIGFQLYNWRGETEIARPGFYVDDFSLETGAANVAEAEDFENGFGDWSVVGGVWAVGQPSATDGPVARTGTVAAGTVLDDDYPSSLSTAGAWLVSPEFTVPVADENPVARVWTWSQLRESHRAAVFIREVAGNWIEVDRFFGDNSQWVQKRFNLSAWAERTVQIGFQLYNWRGETEVARPGFYVDDFSLETGPASLASTEDFEAGYGDWSVLGGVWAVGEPTAADGPMAHSGTALAGTVLDDDYPTSLSTAGAWLVSPEFIVPDASRSPIARVWIWSELRESHRAVVSIREIGGNWTELDRFTGDNSQWVQLRLDISPWAERTVQIGFQLYNWRGETEVARPGFYVDDFSILTE